MIAAALFWSTGGTAIKLAHLPPQAVAGGRALIAGALLFLLLPQSRLRPNRRIAWVALFYAIVCTLFVFATTYTTAGNAIFIQNTAPVWVLLASPFFLNERPTKVQRISVPVALFGCLLFFLDDPEFGLLKGNAIAFVSGLAYAALVIAWRKASHEEGLAGTAYGSLAIAALMIGFIDFGAIDLKGAVAIGYLGTLQQALPAFLFVRGMRGASAMEASLITLLEPVFSPILAFLIVHERLGPLSIAGGIIIVGATIWRIRAEQNAGDLTGGEQRWTRGEMMKALTIIAVLICIAAGGAYFYLHHTVNTPIDANDKTVTVFEVPKGATFNQVATQLEKAGYVRDATAIKVWLKLNPDTPPPKAGKHELTKSMNVAALLAALAAKPLSEDVELTIVEGWRLRDIDKYLVDKGWIEAGEYVKAAADKSKFKTDFTIEGKECTGYLFPSTYLVPPGKLDVPKLIQRQLDEFNTRFVLPNGEEIKQSGKSLQTIVIVASMLEREEPKPDNRSEVAGVMFKRLQLNEPLGIDATSRFTLDDWNDERGFIKLLKNPSDPYNTRLRPGLPPGPIGEPSLPSLIGALRGKPGKWLYYLHDKDGNVHFARNGDEHDKNRKKYNVW
jgi:UPF0755 protein